jgi:hypothetical protein
VSRVIHAGFEQAGGERERGVLAARVGVVLQPGQVVDLGLLA